MNQITKEQASQALDMAAVSIEKSLPHNRRVSSELHTIAVGHFGVHDYGAAYYGAVASLRYSVGPEDATYLAAVALV